MKLFLFWVAIGLLLMARATDATIIVTRRQRFAVPRDADPEGTCHDAESGLEVSFGHTEMWKCASALADTAPKDGHITAAEIDAAMYQYMSLGERGLVTAASGDTHHHLRDCSGSFFGSITRQSMLRYRNTCMPLQRDRCMFKGLCDRVAKQLGKTGGFY